MTKSTLLTAALVTALSFSASAAYAASPEPAAPVQAVPISAPIQAVPISANAPDESMLPVFPVYNEAGEVVGTTRMPAGSELPTRFLVDGKPVDLAGSSPYLQDGLLMVPLRAIAEALGYQVVWHGDTQSVDVIRGAVWSGIYIGSDAYAFGKMAPAPLGAAPVLKDSVTYVPIAFFGDVLRDERHQDRADSYSWTTGR
ncbi:hypothetical protein J31TS4_37530 [Paenibacillus sp. J31TS4]|uniref:copper amine oxidase N-terminal domain-containing protein n=1 Tax=Paenibacillus sp. J31TS4 TaxID=2807195 RepID=UPI001B0A0B4C|nr:copper amine oxidase N-terminal domain-containing protein [Paenibacillus sp. J31TS4]GIP40473.1 hypothetical protein J31TS4_37530 [Paenibacillus sp. J31TS4]